MSGKSQVGAGAMLSQRSRTVQAVHSPLGFFVLALLIVEFFLVGAGVWFELPTEWKLVAIAVGVFLFLLVFGTVVWLVVTRPQNLVFSEESHVQFAAMKMFGSEGNLITGRDLEALTARESLEAASGQLTSPDEKP